MSDGILPKSFMPDPDAINLGGEYPTEKEIMMKNIMNDDKIDKRTVENIKKLLNNPKIKYDDLGPKDGYDAEFEFSPKYTKKEIDNELYDLSCEAPNVFVFYSVGKIDVQFEHDLIDIGFDPNYCSDCSISKKCPRYQWDK